MSWMVYFIGGSRDLQKHVIEKPQRVFECAVLEQMVFPSSGAIIETAITYKREYYSFRPMREGLGVYVHEETK
jgi:hypothetical protein